MIEQAGHQYDVFISYAPSDVDWVRGNVQQWLEGVELDVLVEYRDFQVGVPRIKNIERAVLSSQYTLAVVTHSWIDNEWTECEELLVSTMDPARRKRKLIPLLVDDCKLPWRVAGLTPVDFTDPAQWGVEQARLLRQVGANPVRVDEYNTGRAIEGLVALRRLMSNPDVLQIVRGFRGDFLASSERFRDLANHKAVHMWLHRLQLRCYGRLCREERHFPKDAEALERLRDCECDLEEMTGRLQALVGNPTFAQCDTSWVDQLTQVGEDLHASIETSSKDMLRDATRRLNHVISRWLMPTNECLREAAQELHLSALIDTITRVYDRLDGTNLDAEASHQFHVGIDALVGLEHRLTDCVHRQTKWQDVDRKLRLCELYLYPLDRGELGLAWEEVKQKVASLCRGNVEPGALRLRKSCKKLEAALEKGSDAEVVRHFLTCWAMACHFFYHVDEGLYTLCGRLVRLEQPLDTIVARIGG